MKLITQNIKDYSMGSDAWIFFFLFNILIENNCSGLPQNMSVCSINFKKLQHALFNISYMRLFKLK